MNWFVFNDRAFSGRHVSAVRITKGQKGSIIQATVAGTAENITADIAPAHAQRVLAQIVKSLKDGHTAIDVPQIVTETE